MTLELLPLLTISLLSIATLALFARHNKRTGWVKQRHTFVRDLLALQDIWEESDAAAAIASANRIALPASLNRPITPEDAARFSSDLGMLWRALDAPTVAPETVRETVAA